MGLFGFGGSKGIVGVDISSSSIKAVELKPVGKSGTEFQLVNLGLEPLPPEAIVVARHGHDDGLAAERVVDRIQRVVDQPILVGRAAEREIAGEQDEIRWALARDALAPGLVGAASILGSSDAASDLTISASHAPKTGHITRSSTRHITRSSVVIRGNGEGMSQRQLIF